MDFRIGDGHGALVIHHRCAVAGDINTVTAAADNPDRRPESPSALFASNFRTGGILCRQRWFCRCCLPWRHHR